MPRANADGSGVVAGVSKIGSVRGYYLEDGQREPHEGKLFYRGYDVEEIVSAHRAADTDAHMHPSSSSSSLRLLLDVDDGR